MYWPGDSKNEHIRKRWLSLRYQGGIRTVWNEEIVCAYRSNISICCIIWYLLTAYLCLLTQMDKYILPWMFGENGWEKFQELDYYRCSLCRRRKKVIKVLWWSNEQIES